MAVAAGFAVCLAMGVAGAALSRPGMFGAAPRIAADDPAAVVRGLHLYQRYCRGCHGRELQGQALWRMTQLDGLRRAPALDFTGPAWARDDRALVRIIAQGGARDSRGARMPRFDGVMSPAEIADVLAFVEAHWPRGVRVLHAFLQPRRDAAAAGAAAGAGGSDANWRLPAWCAPGHSVLPLGATPADLAPARSRLARYPQAGSRLPKS